MNKSNDKEIDVFQNNMPMKDISSAMARPCQYRRVIRESRDGALEQRVK